MKQASNPCIVQENEMFSGVGGGAEKEKERERECVCK